MSGPLCKNLVLDAGPLLSLSPLRGLAETYYTVPQVLAELKDKNAREHFERLGLTAGVKVEVAAPDAASLANVIQWAKKTGDYAINDAQSTKPIPSPESSVAHPIEKDEAVEIVSETEDGPPDSESDEEATSEDEDLEPLDVELHPLDDGDDKETSASPTPRPSASDEPIFEDPSDEDDGEGEWITPGNVALHKSRAMGILPDDDADSKRKGKGKMIERISVGCMTADFAMQNVLLQMGLNLVGTEGKRIHKVKSWVLRCHACFKICKDNTKKFCPSCGNPTLLRASVTISSPDAPTDAPVMQVHLKSNFQYRIRGTKYSIPAPKPGSAKTGTGEGLILREDQTEWIRAKKMADGRREREETKMNRSLMSQKGNGIGSWLDPDWVPEMLSVGAGGKGRTNRHAGDMPTIGHGRKNPNERRKRK
ncbi:unnamed protein product [Mycena citricolor]|uniref:20S-pre-rRNA D-site endonuclease NOB1 n=1 Tax=Mycena citricolor TaxID=2018698 RepID=A0AAD2K2H1_9AGAR|nr:unnamed protein product [Mycena citricolor]